MTSPPPRPVAVALWGAALTLAVLAAAPADAVPPERFTRLPARGIGPERPCPPKPARLATRQSGTTFVYRIQHPWNVERLARIRAAWPEKLPLQNRDLFLVRARSHGAAVADRMIDGLRDASLLSGELFGCNRLIAMTGVRLSGGNRDEWAYNQLGNPRIWSVAPDWERMIFDAAWPDTAGPDRLDPEPEWSDSFGVNVSRIRRLADVIRQARMPAGVVVTAWRGSWQYADLARRTHTDYQLLQTQSVCRRSPGHFGPKARDLVRQFHNRGMSTATMALQVSFSQHPNATRFENDTVPGQAARCTAAAYGAGVRNFLLWGPPDSLDEYFAALPDRVRAPGCTIFGGPRRDVIRGTERRDVICGGAGNDRLKGMGGNDVLIGEGGADVLEGGDGGDRLRGGDGDDVLDGGKGRDICDGGPGRNTLGFGCDEAPPELRSVTAAPPAGGQVAITARIVDDISGIGPAGWPTVLTFRSPSGGQILNLWLDRSNRISGTPTAATYAGSLALPAGIEPGQWSLGQAVVWDQAGNHRLLGRQALDAAGVGASFTA